jgi:flagellar export protein FliJ
MSRPVPGRRFRLETVERLRAARLEAGGRELVAAGAALADARERRDLIAGRLLASGLSSRATPEEALSLVARRDLLREQLALAEREVAARVAEAELARVAWLHARSGLRAVEALHERHRRAVRAEQARRGQAETDELAAAAASPGDGGAP